MLSPFKLQAFNHIAIVTVQVVAQVEAPIGHNWSHYHHRGCCWCLQRFILILLLLVVLLPGHEVPNLHTVPMVNPNHSVCLSVYCHKHKARQGCPFFQFAPPETKAWSGRERDLQESKQTSGVWWFTCAPPETNVALTLSKASKHGNAGIKCARLHPTCVKVSNPPSLSPSLSFLRSCAHESSLSSLRYHLTPPIPQM